VKKHESLLSSMLAEFKTSGRKENTLCTNSNMQKSEEERELKTALRETVFLISTKSTENEAHH